MGGDSDGAAADGAFDVSKIQNKLAKRPPKGVGSAKAQKEKASKDKNADSKKPRNKKVSCQALESSAFIFEYQPYKIARPLQAPVSRHVACRPLQQARHAFCGACLLQKPVNFSVKGIQRDLVLSQVARKWGADSSDKDEEVLDYSERVEGHSGSERDTADMSKASLVDAADDTDDDSEDGGLRPSQ